MIPRKRLDIGWRDLFFGMAHCFAKGRRDVVETACQQMTAEPDHALFFLSVRSGLNALLQTLNFPQGSHILVSAITIPDILTILKIHGLIPVPVDIDPETLSPDLDVLKKGIQKETVAILVTHLFGGRVPMDEIVQLAQRHGLYVFEDYAQGFWGDAFAGHPGSDVSMFSFGSIKHNTALGGGLIFVRDRELHHKVTQVHKTYPMQSRWYFFTRLVKYALLTFLSRPGIYTLLCDVCHKMGKSHDMLYLTTRGFAGAGFFEKIRQQPSYPLLSLLLRRLKSDAFARIHTKSQMVTAFRKTIPDICCPSHNKNHAHWLFPICISHAEALCKRLWDTGFDAHLWPVSMCVVTPVDQVPDLIPENAQALRPQLLFLPVYPGIEKSELDRMAQIVNQHHLDHKVDTDTDMVLGNSNGFNALSVYSQSGGASGIHVMPKQVMVDTMESLRHVVDTPAPVKKAEKSLAQTLGKPTDGFISRHFNRKISTRISRHLAKTPITPNQLSITTMAITCLASYWMTSEIYLWFVMGGLLFQFASIVDGCDGEVARLKSMASPKGEWVDTLADNTSYFVFFACITYAMYRNTEQVYTVIAGVAAILLYLLAFGIESRYLHQAGSGSTMHFHKAFSDDMPIHKQKGLHRFFSSVKFVCRRDFFALCFCILSVLNRLDIIYWTLIIGLSVMSLCILGYASHLMRNRRQNYFEPSIEAVKADIH